MQHRTDSARAAIFVSLAAVAAFGAFFAAGANEAFATKKDAEEGAKVTICHFNNGQGGSWNAIEVDEHGWNGHEHHSEDFLVTENAPCPPSQQEGDDDDDSSEEEHEAHEEYGDDDDSSEEEAEMVTVCHYFEEHDSWYGYTVHADHWDGHEHHEHDFLVTDEAPCPPAEDEAETVTVCQYFEEHGGWYSYEMLAAHWAAHENTDTKFLVTDETPCPPSQQEGDDDDDSEDVDACPDLLGMQYSAEECPVSQGDDDDDDDSSEEVPATGGAGKLLNASSASGGDGADAVDADADEGEVLGASCTVLLTTYIKEGADNAAEEVEKLQGFLNEELGISLAVTGIYDAATVAAVNDFQVKYWEDVLAPWVPFGLPTAQTPTGYVYKTTQWKINMIACPSLALPAPKLP